MHWLGLVYSGDVVGTFDRPNPHGAARMLADNPGLIAGDPYLACAVGDEEAVQLAVYSDPAWINRPGGALLLPPLVAVTHSTLLRLPEFRERLHRCAKLLLAAGADPNQRIFSRSPPASVQQPDTRHSLSALYGAAGVNHDVELTGLLLDAGADPNDGESLYHALDSTACTRVLLERGARVTGSNAMYRVFDLDNPAVLELLLDHGGNANEPARHAPLSDWEAPLLWAIRRRRSLQHIALLLKAGADPAATTPDGVSAVRLALQFGLEDVAALLGGADEISDEEAFIAACARGDAAAALRIQARRPDLPAALSETRLRLLPDMASEGARDGVMTMVELGWPIAVRGGDWQASALNLAVFRGDAVLTRFLLGHGARWTEQHGHGDNVAGTLSWASCNEPHDGGDWAGCAAALRDHGLPAAEPDRDDPAVLVIDGKRRRFCDAVRDVLLRSFALNETVSLRSI